VIRGETTLNVGAGTDAGRKGGTLTDDQPQRRESGNGLADADIEVRREYEALNDLLAGLSRNIDDAGLPLIAAPAEPERLSRWVVVLRGVRRLTEVVAFRDELLKIPFCIAVRVTDVTVDETRAVVTATTTLEVGELEQLVTETLQMVGSTATVDTIAKYSPVAG